MPSVALLGTGTMGAGMGARLLQAGFPLTVWNRSAERAAPLVAQGASAAQTPADAARDADVVIAMVAHDRASRDVWLGEQGALATARPGAVLIESSTLTPQWIRELAAAAQKGGRDLLDAPVTGSRTHAAAGQLLFLVGGDADVLARVRPVLEPMSRGIVHLGRIGSGAVLKLVNNFVCGVQAASFAEALVMIEKSGLDVGQALPVLLEGAPGSPLVKTVAQRMVERNYDVHFKLALMLKDLAYAEVEAEELGLKLSTTLGAALLFQEAKEQGHGDADMAAIAEMLRAGGVPKRSHAELKPVEF